MSISNDRCLADFDIPVKIDGIKPIDKNKLRIQILNIIDPSLPLYENLGQYLYYIHNISKVTYFETNVKELSIMYDENTNQVYMSYPALFELILNSTIHIPNSIVSIRDEREADFQTPQNQTFITLVGMSIFENYLASQVRLYTTIKELFLSHISFTAANKKIKSSKFY